MGAAVTRMGHRGRDFTGRVAAAIGAPGLGARAGLAPAALLTERVA